MQAVQPGNLPVSTVLWQPTAASYCVTVVTKLTLVLVPNELVVAAEQEPINETDSHWNDDPARSLSSVADLAPAKPRADVVVVGHAFAPGGRPTRSLVARVAIEGFSKAVEVWADRSLGPDGNVYEGPPFARMPLRYERAAGGPGTANPVGVAPGGRDPYGRMPLPNLQPVGFVPTPAAPCEPIGLGPIAATWPQRAKLLGRHEGAFAPEQWMHRPLPEGLDMAHFNVAPPDQQIDAIREHATVLLENLHREHAVLSTRLPGLRPRATFERRGAVQEVPMRADLLAIDTDRGICTLTWRGQVTLENAAERPRFQVALEAGKAAPPSPPTAAPPSPARPASERRGRQAQTLLDSTGSESTRAIAWKADPASGTPWPATTNGLPFAASAAPPPPPPPTPPGARSALPFAPSAPAPPPPPPPAPPAGIVAPPMPALGTALPPLEPRIGDASSVWADPGLARAKERAAEPFVPPTSTGWSPPAAPPLAAERTPAPSAAASPWGASAPEPPPAVNAALVGAVEASNAAAERRPGAGGGLGGAPVMPDEALELLWFDKEAAPRLHRRREWKKILDALEEAPFDPELEEPPGGADAADSEDRREIFEVVTRGAPAGENGVDHALAGAVRADGRFTPQLMLLAGEIRFDFDELELLKATVSAATPFAGAEGDLKSALDTATAFLGTPGVVSSPEVTTSLTTNIREAFSKTPRPVPATYLEDVTERALLERRAYQKRPVFGDPHLRGLFFFPGSTTGVPTYFPEPMIKKLPLFRRLRVRMLAEAHFQADQYETHPTALRAAAVVRVIASRREEPRV
jgi:hypothetical protein